MIQAGRPLGCGRRVHGLVPLRLAAAGCLLLTVVVGCRQSGPVVEMVEGTVTLDGAPIEGVTVTFKPVGAAGLMAFGMTRADGRFTLNATRGGRAGAGTAVGDYAVTFTKTKGGYEVIDGPTAPEAPPPDIETAKAEYEKWAREQAQKKPRPLPPVEYLVPKAYGDANTSGFTATVKRGRNTGDAFRFDLKSDFPGR
jgi:hypothetical protein